MSADRSAKAFPAASWGGSCAECGEEFEPGVDVGYVEGLLCCGLCWESSAPAEAAPIEDLVELAPPAAVKDKPKRARKAAGKALPAPRAKKAPVLPKDETRPAAELVGAGPIRRMEERQAAMMEDPENDAAAMLFAAAGLLDDDAPEQPALAEVQVGEGGNAFVARVEPVLADMRLAAVDMLADVPQPETVHRVEEPETSALEDTSNAFGDLVESPAQGAGKYDHLPLSAAQWAEQAAALQAAGTAPQTEYRINGERVSLQAWQDYQATLQDALAATQPGEQINYEPATPDPLAAAAAYRVCERQHVTNQTPCEQCAEVVRAEGQAQLQALQAAAARQMELDEPEQGLLSRICADIVAEQEAEERVSKLKAEAAAADVANAQGWLGDDEPAGDHGLTFRELAQLSDTEDALQATPARYAGPLDEQEAGKALDHLEGILLHAIEQHPRSQQKRIGPSELGTPCDHCLAAKLSEWEEVRAGGSWLPTIGTAVHTWIEQQLLEHMRRGLDAGRYLAEHKVVTGAILGKLIPGSTDVFDVVAGMTVDWKIVGATTLKAARRGPSLVYRRQQHLYAKGWRDMGAQVDWVAIEYLPRNAQSLKERIRWLEPYSEAEAVAALERAEAMRRMLDSVQAVGGVEQRDAFITMLPRDKDCHDCKRFPDFPRAPLDQTAGGLIDLGEED